MKIETREVDCPDCGGTGNYVGLYGGSAGPCRLCRGRGKVMQPYLPRQEVKVWAEDEPIPAEFLDNLAWINGKDAMIQEAEGKIAAAIKFLESAGSEYVHTEALLEILKGDAF